MTTQDAPSPPPKSGGSTLYGQIVGGAFAIPLALLIVFAGANYHQVRTVAVSDALETLDAVATVQESRIDGYVGAGVASFRLTVSRSRLIGALSSYGSGDDVAARGEMLASLQTVIDSSSDIRSVTIFDPDGRFILYAGPAGDRLHIPSEVSRAARESLTVGSVSAVPDRFPVHLIGGPVVVDGETIGSAVMAQSMEPLFELTGDWTGLGRTGETILARSLPQGAQFIAPLRFDPGAALVRLESAGKGNLPMITALAAEEVEIRDGVDYRGEAVYSVTRFVDSTGWGLVVKKDITEVLEPAGAIARFGALTLIIGLGIAGLAARRVAQSIAEPISQMAVNARAISEGRRDLTVETELEEVEELAEAFHAAIAEVDALNAGLEAKVEKRTWQLKEKNEKLRRVMAEKEVFLAGVSHELRSPLTAMIGFIDLVVASGEALEPEDRDEMLGTISAQADDVLNLIEDLLASARVEAGTLNVVSVPVDLAAEACQVIEATQGGSKAEVTFTGGEAKAAADPARVRQVLRNLISNAIRYGGPTINVQVSDGADEVLFDVCDDGEGIPEADRSAVFDAYVQSDATRQVAESVGLGLSVSRELARLMGGDLTYDYRDGQSTFSVRLPRLVDDEEAETGSDAEMTMTGAQSQS